MSMNEVLKDLYNCMVLNVSSTETIYSTSAHLIRVYKCRGDWQADMVSKNQATLNCRYNGIGDLLKQIRKFIEQYE